MRWTIIKWSTIRGILIATPVWMCFRKNVCSHFSSQALAQNSVWSFKLQFSALHRLCPGHVGYIRRAAHSRSHFTIESVNWGGATMRQIIDQHSKFGKFQMALWNTLLTSEMQKQVNSFTGFAIWVARVNINVLFSWWLSSATPVKVLFMVKKGRLQSHARLVWHTHLVLQAGRSVEAGPRAFRIGSTQFHAVQSKWWIKISRKNARAAFSCVFRPGVGTQLVFAGV